MLRRAGCGGRLRSGVPLIDMRRPIWPHVGTDYPTDCADHPAAECSNRQVVREAIAVHRRAVMATARAAIDEQIAAAMAADMADGYGRECFGLAAADYADCQ